jgi:hypothetical protein
MRPLDDAPNTGELLPDLLADNAALAGFHVTRRPTERTAS